MTIDTEDNNQETTLAAGTFPEPADLDEKMREEFQNFDVLLDEITVSNHQLKNLWKLIFENASTDRKNAYIAFVDLYIKCHGHVDQHAINGPNITKYLERMEKSNAQLLKLAELVAKALPNKTAEDSEEDEDEKYMPKSSRDIFSEIEKRKKH